jgi:hypothetical protein
VLALASHARDENTSIAIARQINKNLLFINCSPL